MSDEKKEEEPRKGETFRVRVEAKIALEIPLHLKDRVDALQVAEETLKAHLQTYDKNVAVMVRSVLIRENEG